MRGASKCSPVARARRRRPAAAPKRHAGGAEARRDQQRLLERAQRQRRMARLVAKRTFLDLEAETEAPRAPAIERLEQRIVPGRLQQVLHARERSLYWSKKL